VEHHHFGYITKLIFKKKNPLGWSLTSWLDGRSVLWQKIHHFAILKNPKENGFFWKITKKKFRFEGLGVIFLASFFRNRHIWLYKL
jgi:hypothetical protein